MRKYGAGCKGCKYHRRLSGAGVNTTMACHFLYDTGEARGCPAGEGCTRYEPTTKGKRLRKFLAEF